jgi:hypothetical protein
MHLNKPKGEKPGMLEVWVEQASELDDVLATAIEVIKKAATAQPLLPPGSSS